MGLGLIVRSKRRFKNTPKPYGKYTFVTSDIHHEIAMLCAIRHEIQCGLDVLVDAPMLVQVVVVLLVVGLDSPVVVGNAGNSGKSRHAVIKQDAVAAIGIPELGVDGGTVRCAMHLVRSIRRTCKL